MYDAGLLFDVPDSGTIQPGTDNSGAGEDCKVPLEGGGPSLPVPTSCFLPTAQLIIYGLRPTWSICQSGLATAVRRIRDIESGTNWTQRSKAGMQ